MARPCRPARERGAFVSALRGIPRRLRHEVRRLFYATGYNVTNMAKEREQAARLSGEKWRWLNTLDIGTLVDVGANTGQFARDFRDVRPDTLIYSFEPLRDCFEELQRTMADTLGFTAFNVALGESDGEVVFFRSESSASSSLLRMGESHKELFPFTRDITPQTVTLRRLDSYLDEITVRGGLLIKIDVQGAELEVLRGAQRFLEVANAVIAEVGYLPLYEGQGTLMEMANLLQAHGLSFMGIVDQYSRPGDSLPVYGDALFARLSVLQQREGGCSGTQLQCADATTGAASPRLETPRSEASGCQGPLRTTRGGFLTAAAVHVPRRAPPSHREGH